MINQEQIRSLINKYNYEAALEIYGQHAGDNDVLQSFLEVTNLLFANEVKAAVDKAGRNPTRSNSVMQELRSKASFSFNFALWDNLLQKEIHFKLCLLLEIAFSYDKRGDKGFNILYNHIFFERFLSEIINPFLQDRRIEDAGSWKCIKERLLTKEIFPEFVPPDGITIDELYSASLPVQRSMALSIKEDRVSKLLTALDSSLQNTFSNLRNKFAHEGRSISNDDISCLIPVFKELRQIMGLHPDKTLFDNYNDSIRVMLKKEAKD